MKAMEGEHSVTPNTATGDTSTAITLRVARSGGSGGSPGFAQYSVPAVANARVLDALLHVRRHHDATLAFRYSCRVGMCGSCAIVINGKEGLACQTTIASLGTRTVRLEPLRALPVLRDLTADMTPFFRASAVSEAVLRPKSPRAREVPKMPPATPHRALIESQSGCITCGACFSACELSSTRKDFLGPATLNRLLMLSLDERDSLGKTRLETAARDHGVLRCHTMGNCSAVCPANIPLREGMQRLKGLIAAGK